MWQHQLIGLSMKLQSNSNGGIFRYLTSVNDMLQIMLSSWLINIYFILLPVFTIIAVFLLIQSLRGWSYCVFPKLQYVLPFLLIFTVMTGSVVFIQLLEINDDSNKVQQQSDSYINEFQYQMYLSINNTKKSFIDSLRHKKKDILPVVESMLTDLIRMADNTSKSATDKPTLNVDIFTKSDIILKVFDLARDYINSSNKMRGKQIQLDHKCDLSWLEQGTYCTEFPNECVQFSSTVNTIKKAIKNRQLNNSFYVTTFEILIPMIEGILKSFKLDQFVSTPAQYYDIGVELINSKLDSAINTKLKATVNRLIDKSTPTLNTHLRKVQIILKVVIFAIILMNSVFFLFILLSLFVTYRNKANVKKGHSCLWSVSHFGTYIFGTIVLIGFVTGTSVLLNSQTEICRYLGDISHSADVADRYIDAFLDQQGKYILAKNIPDKILSIPNLNLKNPRRILTTIIRLCPAKMILLPSLEMYRPINTTALIFSDFVKNEVLKPNMVKLNHTVYDNIDKVLEITNTILDSKNNLLHLLRMFPRADNATLHFNYPFKGFVDIVNDEELLSKIATKLSQGVEIERQLKVMSMNRERKQFRQCFEELSNLTTLNNNEKILKEVVLTMNYFETLIKNVVLTLQNIGDNINQKKELFFSDYLKAVILPLRVYASRLIGLLEEETLSKVIPCNELSTFYSDTVNGLCTNQLGNFLVLMIFGTLTFTLKNFIEKFYLFKWRQFTHHISQFETAPKYKN